MAKPLKPFEEILAQGVRENKIPARTQDARDWYREAARTFRKRINDQGLFKNSDKDRMSKRFIFGSMYMYYYDPKHKETLPYYDRLPLIFPVEPAPGGFYGINLHYLPLPFRAKLMDALYNLVNNNRYDESTKIRISYEILKASSKHKFFKPCFKHYLNDHVRSQFMYIYPSEWDIALFLPLERFEKKNKTQVWAESKKIIRGTK